MEAIGVVVIFGFLAWIVSRFFTGGSQDTRAAEEEPSYMRASTASDYARTATSAPARQVTRQEPARWLPPGQSVEIQGYALPDGMLYVGQGLTEVTGYGSEPALINPRLPADRSALDRVGASMPYWPTYEGLSPQSRAAFLDWLASGRRAADIGIGYVFLFLYGLERRVYVDAQTSPEARAELGAIRAEVAALLNVYGSNRSFERYASQLLGVLDSMAPGEVPLVPPAFERSYDMPISIRVGLGRLLAAEQPLPAAWALAWLASSPQYSLRTPAKRCSQEFQALFHARYTREYGAGLTVKAPRTKLRAEIRPASGSFGGAHTLEFDQPDIARLSAPLTKIQAIAEDCEADLEAFSRWVGRNPDAPRTLAAVALLPQELVATHESAEVQALWSWLSTLLKSGPVAFCDGEELLKRCASLWGDKLTRTEAILLAQLLQKGGYGLEPDARFGGGLPSAGEDVAVFQLEPEAPSTASPGYAAAATLLHLAVAVSAADESVTDQEREQLEAHVERNLSLSDPERRRLSIHLAWLMRSQPRLTGLRKRLEPLEAGQRAVIADFVVSVAAADGRVSPSEVKAIEKIFGLLGIAREHVYSRLHASSAESIADAPLPVVIPGQPNPGYKVPPPPPAANAVPLDMEAVAAKLAQSASMAAVLNEIFTDDAEPAPPAPAKQDTAPNGLSASYNQLLKALSQRGQWDRGEFEQLAGQHKLLPDAALDALNEAAFERCGSALLEGDDPIEVNPDIAKELLS